MLKTKVVKVNARAPEARAMAEAAEVLEAGGLVVFPTETVYGIAASLLNKEAMKRLVAIKDRPENKNFSIHIGDKKDVQKYAVDVLPRAYKVMEKFWPGPLTLVLAAPNSKSVGLRMPNNEVASQLLRRVDGPVVAPSANRAGQPPARDGQDAARDLEGLVEMVLDAGPVELGEESTVVDGRVLPFKVLREGFLKKEDVLAVAQEKTVLFVCTGNSCRSVMAEYLLKKRLSREGRQDVEVLSAGTFAFFGMGPTAETTRLIDGIGLDASGHRAQKVHAELLKKSDAIFAMERHHCQEVLRLCPECQGRVFLLGESAAPGSSEPEISDPLGHSEDFYRMSFQKIRAAVDRLEI